MKKIKSTIAPLLLAAMLLALWTVPAAAADIPEKTVEVVYFSDGSYLTTEVTYTPALLRASSTTSGKKNATYSNSSGETQWTLTVNGSFSFNGSSATATSASYSYKIYDSGWRIKSGDAYCSGNKAIAEASFVGSVATRSATVTLSCSANGTLS